ncbi:MAG: GNAT family N-acetyltransferase [Anaerolineae bacterium]|nr:GNAT family N-acetyltransferase [Anaerolineae bacterium]
MIRGEKIILRTVRKSDLDILFDLLSDIKNRGDYVPWDLPTQVEQQRQFQENCFWGDSQGTLLICVSNQIAGTISFIHAGYHDALEIGYAVFDEVNRNKGYATEALALFVKYLFSTKKINRLQISIDPENIPSKRVAEKCGFILEGIMRGAIFHHGTYHNVESYSLLRADVNDF